MNGKEYKGTALEKPQLGLKGKIFSLGKDGKPVYKVGSTQDIFPYFPSKELVQAVKIARLLNRPLLVQGEPGSGKTRLAQAIAFELHGKDYRKNYFEWHIKSTTKAKDGLYQFDYLNQLRDMERSKIKVMQDEDEIEVDPKKYRSFGSLGKAFITSTNKDKPSILLIDEIDKADLDFPNDLLLELDEKRFEIAETEELVEAKTPPIIIITSNNEKELPNAFLRRCVFHYIDFPELKVLNEIAKARLRAEIMKINSESTYKLAKDDLAFLQMAVARFEQQYKEMESDPLINKKPSTSELLDWIKAIYFTNKESLATILEDGDQLKPYYSVLIKSYNDQIQFMKNREQ